MRNVFKEGEKLLKLIDNIITHILLLGKIYTLKKFTPFTLFSLLNWVVTSVITSFGVNIE